MKQAGKDEVAEKKTCSRCIHLDVCKTADSCNGYVPRCKHFLSNPRKNQTIKT